MGTSDSMEQWDDDDVTRDIDDSEPEEEEIAFVTASPTAKILVRWISLFLLTLQGVFHLPNTALSLLFGFLSTLFVILGRFSDLCKEIAKVFPRSLFLAQRNQSHRFKFQKYVACRKCLPQVSQVVLSQGCS